MLSIWFVNLPCWYFTKITTEEDQGYNDLSFQFLVTQNYSVSLLVCAGG
jgi:hypothetical protein